MGLGGPDIRVPLVGIGVTRTPGSPRDLDIGVPLIGMGGGLDMGAWTWGSQGTWVLGFPCLELGGPLVLGSPRDLDIGVPIVGEG